MNAIDAFWQRFRQVSGRRASSWVSELRQQLAAVAPQLGLEVREGATRTLHVLPVMGTEHSPLAGAFVERAPQLAGWDFRTEREPLELADALLSTKNDCQVDLSRARARVGVGRGHGLELVVASEHFVGLDRDEDLDAVHHLLLQVLGDRLMNHWVCNVSTTVQQRPSLLPLLGADSQRLPLDLKELAPSVRAAVRGIEQGLPEQPCHTDCERADWVMFDCAEDLEVAENAPQSDLLMASTMRPEMLKWHLQGGEFSSARFSRYQEHFCYLQLQSVQNLQDASAERIELEEQIDRWLVPGRLGCVVGAGPGRHSQYIQLALTQLEASIAVLAKKLGQRSEPSWLLFCDSEWRHEWVGFGQAGRPVQPTRAQVHATQ
jgi:hypothetical protein